MKNKLILIFLLPLLSCSSTGYIDRIEGEYDSVKEMAQDLRQDVQKQSDKFFGESFEAKKSETGIQDIIYKNRDAFSEEQWKMLVKANREAVGLYKKLKESWSKAKDGSQSFERYIQLAKGYNKKMETIGSIFGSALKIGAGLYEK